MAWLRLGTRGSPLALAQAHELRGRLSQAQGIAEDEIAIVPIRTTGDMIQDRPLSEAGGKGLFTKELDAALLEGRIDAAAHSSKDLPTILPEGICIAGYLPREDVRDVFVSMRARRLADLPKGAVLGTASLRRQAMARRLRPDLVVTLLRGNVETRLRKAESGEVDATLLALAGLKRLGLAHRATSILEIDDFLPAVGQGAIAVTARAGDAQAAARLAPVFDAATGQALTAERAFLEVLDGSCRTPIGGHARIRDGRLELQGIVLRPDGSQALDVSEAGSPEDAAGIGHRAGSALLARMPTGFLV
jgi:hydroxymethylbilane synthase